MNKPNSDDRVLVTGAAGFLGQHVVREALRGGLAIRATDLPGTDLAWAGELGAEVTYGDLTLEDQVQPMFEGITRVAHLAAVHNLAWPLERLIKVNLGSAVNVATTAARKEVRHFVYCSSADTYGDSSNIPIKEGYEQRPQNNYARSKLAAERAVTELAAKHRMPVTTLRPTIIYGPAAVYAAGVFCTIPIILHKYLGSLPKVEGGPLVNAVHVEDVAAATVYALDHEEMAGQFYNVSDDHWQTSGEYFHNIADPLEVNWGSLTIHLSASSMALSTRLMEWVPALGFEGLNWILQTEWSQIVKKHGLEPALNPRFDKGFLSYGNGDHVYDNTRLKEAGFELRWPRFDEGYRKTIQWYQDQRWIPASARLL
jgi:nucleoside-diphosphate-sugar epimerase